jgi:hypothetical protein
VKEDWRQGAEAAVRFSHLERSACLLVLPAAGVLGLCPLLDNVQLLHQLGDLLLQMLWLLAC